ncbi:nicotinate phosphoribosyltransferase [Paenibacillus sp. FSL R7-0302]|uniref:nicotinate phosphoribosyltransferase n=1 Tax=Paenibacillus sp. FSL R7-0302 TaxID=2921681 RepID=UPI0030F7B524
MSKILKRIAKILSRLVDMPIYNLRKNPIMLTDAYNLSHQHLKCNTDWEVSHMYNRSQGMFLYGFSEIALSVLSVQVTFHDVYEAEAAAKRMGITFPTELWMRVVTECNGYAPLAVEALPEGTWCPAGTPFAQIRNTKKGFGDLVTWWEGVFMMAYFPSACLTEAYDMRQYLEQRANQFGYGEEFMWKFHSFGFRGHRSLEDAYWAGTAWNAVLQGTDDFHTAQYTPNAPIGSIAALAHKVTQQFDNEFDCFKHAIRETAAKGEKVVALVIDTYDAYRVIDEYLVPLSNLASFHDVKIVMRPDSGDTWEQAVRIYKKCKQASITNVSVIIGEGMSFENAKKCDEYLMQHGVPISFVFYGIGGGFYKHIERDTLGWAMKTAFSNGKPRMKFSMEPIKRSIPGRVGVVRKGNDLFVVPHDSIENEMDDLYNYVYLHDAENVNDIPVMVRSDYNEMRERLEDADKTQGNIYVSEEINDLVEQFRKIYKS